MKICVQAQPIPERQTLPKNLGLSLKDTADKILAEIKSEARDNFIQLPHFIGNEAESFKISLTLDSASHEEEFVI
ncbi:DUF1822 family protein [Myxosarcina sp. GI1(2024)]